MTHGLSGRDRGRLRKAAVFISRLSSGEGQLRRRLAQFGLAVAATALAWATDLLLRDYLNEISSALFIAAAMVSAWYGGMQPALVSVVMTLFINILFSKHPHLSLAAGVHGSERLVVFSLVSLLASALIV